MSRNNTANLQNLKRRRASRGVGAAIIIISQFYCYKYDLLVFISPHLVFVHSVADLFSAEPNVVEKERQDIKACLKLYHTAKHISYFSYKAVITLNLLSIATVAPAKVTNKTDCRYTIMPTGHKMTLVLNKCVTYNET